MDVRARARSVWSGSAARPRRRVLIVFIVLAALAAAIWLAVSLANRPAGPGGHGGAGGRMGRGGPGATTVGVATATLSDIPITLDALGTVTPTATVTVTPQVAGVITEILFREGQMVKRGDALAQIDPRPFQIALMQAQGALARDEAQLANARILLKRDQTLLAQDSIARQDVDTQAANVGQLQGTVLADQAAIRNAQLQLGYSRITAPVSGRAGLRQVDVGNYVSVGASGGIVVITEVTPIDVQFTVPQDDVPRIQSQIGGGRMTAVALDRTRTVTLDQGVFSTLDNQIDPTTGTVRAKARFDNLKGALFPQQFVNVRLNLKTLKGVVSVPVTAVRTGPQGEFVWILRPDRTVTKRNVTPGPATATLASVTGGLQAGERVITEGGDRLTEGAHVMLPGDRPSFGGAGGRGGRHGGQGWGAGGGRSDGAASGAAPATGSGQTAEAGPPAQVGGSPSPEFRAARQALIQACASDMASLCAGQEGREAFMCLRENAEKASPGCQAALAKMPHRPHPQGGAGGGG